MVTKCQRQTALAFLGFTFVVSLVSMILAIVAYAEWRANADEYDRIIDNWKTTPVVNFTRVGITESCPSGFDTLTFNSVEYQQAVCTTGGVDSIYYCNTQDPVKNGTDSFQEVDKYAVAFWRDSKLCVLRDGTNAVDRPLNSESGFRLCGTNNETGNYYFDQGKPCPVTYISNVPPTSGGAFESYTMGASGYTLYVSRNPVVGRPFLQFTTGEGFPCKTDLNKFNGIRSSGTPAGLNHTSDAFTVTVTGTATTRNPFRTVHPEFGACDTDSRFSEIDQQPEETLYDDNLNTRGGNVQLSSYVYASDSLSTNWTFWNRPEILWREGCEYSRQEVTNVRRYVSLFLRLQSEFGHL